jgi:glycosyltransferase involved in cell wall biosynthesis
VRGVPVSIGRTLLPAGGISIVIPARNEEAGLPPVLAAYAELVASCNGVLELIVVNDGSTDKTAQVLASGGPARVINHASPMGYGRSIKDGVRQARHAWIAIADADGTYDLRELPSLFEHLAGFDMAVGVRVDHRYPSYRWFKENGRRGIHGLARYLTGQTIPDLNSGLRVFPCAAALELEADLSEGFSYTTTLTLLMLFHGKRVFFQPIRYAPRLGTSKVRIVRDGMRTVRGMIRLGVRHAPLRVFIPVGVAALLIYGIWRFL